MKIKEGFKLRTVGDLHVLMGQGMEHINFNKLISLNSSAAYLWQAIEGKDFSIPSLSDLLVAKYIISHDQALRDASEIVDIWEKEGLLEI